MLPEHLSNNLCSLHPGSPKATLGITMELDPTGKVLRSRIDETLIESKQRFTYDEVQEIIDELDGNLAKGDLPIQISESRSPYNLSTAHSDSRFS